MKKTEIVETKELLHCELIENYHVFYQEIEHQEFVLKDNTLFEYGCFVEKTVTIYRGKGQSTFQKVKSYLVDNLTTGDILGILLRDYPELFKKAITKKAV